MRYNLLSFVGVAQIVLDVATGSPLNLGPMCPFDVFPSFFRSHFNFLTA